MNSPALLDAHLADLAARYVELWNEPDPAARRKTIESLWTPDGANFTRTQEWHGHAALEERVRTSWEKWVRDAGCHFRPRHYLAHHDAMRVQWEMVRPSGEVASVGNEFILLAPDLRIRADYQFVDA